MHSPVLNMDMDFVRETLWTHQPVGFKVVIAAPRVPRLPTAWPTRNHGSHHVPWQFPSRKLWHCRQEFYMYPFPPLQTPGLARDGLPGGGGGDGRQVTVSRGGGGDCKGISRQTVVPSTDASKENTCEATFALMQCQCVSSNTNVIEDPKER